MKTKKMSYTLSIFFLTLLLSACGLSKNSDTDDAETDTSDSETTEESSTIISSGSFSSSEITSIETVETEESVLYLQVIDAEQGIIVADVGELETITYGEGSSATTFYDTGEDTTVYVTDDTVIKKELDEETDTDTDTNDEDEEDEDTSVIPEVSYDEGLTLSDISKYDLLKVTVDEDNTATEIIILE